MAPTRRRYAPPDRLVRGKVPVPEALVATSPSPPLRDREVHVTLVASMITIDCADPQRLAAFWSAVLDTPVERDLGDHVYLARPDDGGIVVSFQRVPQPTLGKARIHLDLNGPRTAEVARVVALGARVVDEHVLPHTAWSVLADPDGNPFCIGEDTPDPAQ
jgi:catechol 2,3-dioxygenase-like lactoylglutathione lyase family enzyme